jgi:hypothetical protein
MNIVIKILKKVKIMKNIILIFSIVCILVKFPVAENFEIFNDKEISLIEDYLNKKKLLFDLNDSEFHRFLLQTFQKNVEPIRSENIFLIMDKFLTVEHKKIFENNLKQYVIYKLTSGTLKNDENLRSLRAAISVFGDIRNKSSIYFLKNFIFSEDFWAHTLDKSIKLHENIKTKERNEIFYSIRWAAYSAIFGIKDSLSLKLIDDIEKELVNSENNDYLKMLLIKRIKFTRDFYDGKYNIKISH